MSDSDDKVVTYGKNALEKFRKHAEQIRRIAGTQNIAIPKKVSAPNTQKTIKDYLEFVVKHGETRIGRYKQYMNAKWSKLGNAIVIRQFHGEFITFLDAKGGGAALNFPGEYEL